MEIHLMSIQIKPLTFVKLKKAELKLKPSTCESFKQEMTYLGHAVSKMVYGLIPKRLMQSVNGQC